ncbi:hypothetical protein NKR23_g6300 [Pleurostoma richardsiae]|uniref:Ribosomal protein L34 n=1 Tax=Pleurostoma richardsiae TaxID=41990 RepID=A0AA38VHW9_9PEZI|nr:hypothetical protein NKR23_g6300 [Pleurostoma richardsiae]
MSRLFFSKSALRAAAPCLPQRTPAVSRSFSSLPGLRPSLASTLPASSPSTVFRPSCAPLGGRLLAPLAPASATGALDLVAQSAISAHPAFGALQIRCGPRPNMNRSSRLIQKRRHGFLSRVRTNKGRKLLKRRQAKGRKRLSA